MDWGLGYATANLCRHWGTELGNRLTVEWFWGEKTINGNGLLKAYTYFRLKVKWRLERLGVLGTMGETVGIYTWKPRIIQENQLFVPLTGGDYCTHGQDVEGERKAAATSSGSLWYQRFWSRKADGKSPGQPDANPLGSQQVRVFLQYQIIYIQINNNSFIFGWMKRSVMKEMINVFFVFPSVEVSLL